MTWMGSELGLLRSQPSQDEEATFLIVCVVRRFEWVSFKTSCRVVGGSLNISSHLSFSDVFG